MSYALSVDSRLLVVLDGDDESLVDERELDTDITTTSSSSTLASIYHQRLSMRNSETMKP